MVKERTVNVFHWEMFEEQGVLVSLVLVVDPMVEQMALRPSIVAELPFTKAKAPCERSTTFWDVKRSYTSPV